jgi:serine/threonine protein kinase
MSQHPNIVRLLDIFEDDRHFFVILEYLNGGDLYDYMLRRNFNISEERARELCHQIGSAVLYLHKYGIVHRDLKLENIMMTDDTEESVSKLVDFGLCKLMGPGQKASESLGTIAYASPEILKGNAYDFCIDVWSLGVIFFVLLSGTLPFEAETQDDTANLIIESDLQFSAPKWKKLDQRCVKLVEKMLRKKIEKRITLPDVVNDLWLQGKKS